MGKLFRSESRKISSLKHVAEEKRGDYSNAEVDLQDAICARSIGR